MFFVEVDKLRNILRLTFELTLDEKVAKQCLKEVETCLLRLEPGFSILTDMRNVESITPSAAPYIEQIMDICNERGVSKVVRVIPDSSKDGGLNIMSVFHYGRDVRIITYPTLVEALNKLLIKK